LQRLGLEKEACRKVLLDVHVYTVKQIAVLLQIYRVKEQEAQFKRGIGMLYNKNRPHGKLPICVRSRLRIQAKERSKHARTGGRPDSNHAVPKRKNSTNSAYYPTKKKRKKRY
jgi:hypothetical protein